MNAPARQGLILGMSNADYHAHPALSCSKLKDFMVCPANYYGLHLDPDMPAREETVGQRAGTLLHTLVLEPETFDQRYAIGPDCTRAAKAWKEWEESLLQEVAAIKRDEHDAARRQAASLRRHTEVADLLTSGYAEASVFWTDPETGLECRCRPDWLHELEEGWIVLDIKTGPANPGEFSRQCARMAYDVQEAFYTPGIEIATGKPVLAFLFGVVETTIPYLSSCPMLDDDSRESARRKVRRAMGKFAECHNNNHWPGYEGVETVRLPAYAIEE